MKITLPNAIMNSNREEINTVMRTYQAVVETVIEQLKEQGFIPKKKIKQTTTLKTITIITDIIHSLLNMSLVDMGIATLPDDIEVKINPLQKNHMHYYPIIKYREALTDILNFTSQESIKKLDHFADYLAAESAGFPTPEWEVEE